MKKHDRPIPYVLVASERPIPYRLPRAVRMTGTLEDLVVPKGAKPCAPPARESDPRLAEAV
jgi:hypothetical protein